jgi:cytochrome c-type biogenesis protein CcmH
MAFWIAALAISAAVVLYIARPLAVARRATPSRAAHDAQVFRDQLAEIDKDRERGVLTGEEAESAKIEVSRRLLAAAAESEASPDHAPAPKLASYAMAAALVAALPLAGWTLYEQIGAPGLPDLPFADRMDGRRLPQTVAELRIGAEPPPPPPGSEQVVEVIADIEARLEANGPDRQGLFLLGQAYSQIGRFGDAWRAYDRLLDLTDRDAPAAVFIAQAEAMILAAQGYVSPEAEETLSEALRRSPSDPIARYYMGAAFAQTSRPESALETWIGLLEDSPPDAPWRQPILAQIDDLIQRTGLPRPEIPAPRMPTAEEQEQTTLALIARLESRLQTDGADPIGWAELVRSWRTLDRDAEAAAAEEQARAALADDAEALAAFEEALTSPGVDPVSPHDADPRAAVAALDARLRAEGGNAAAWSRLVNSYAAMGAMVAAQDAADRARAALSEQPEQLAALEEAIGTRAGGADGLRGPTAEDVAAASEMSSEDRSAMIRGMVDGLRERLYDEGGSGQEWARLIRAMGVLGDREAAADALARGLDAHGDDAQTAMLLRRTALDIGLSVE